MLAVKKAILQLREEISPPRTEGESVETLLPPHDPVAREGLPLASGDFF